MVMTALATLTACQPPQPFRSQDPARENPLARPTYQAGLLVRAVPGAADPVGFAARVAEQLRRLDVNATTLGANVDSYLLTGEARTRAASDGKVTLTLDWLLSDPKGRELGHRLQTATVWATDWAHGNDTLTARLANEAAHMLAPLMGDKRAPAAGKPVLIVYSVDGAPGDGDVSLRRAMAYALTRRGFHTVDTLSGANVVITGAVQVKSAGPGIEQVSITWSALGPDGASLGNVRQSNRVPKGSLQPNWGVTAIDVAEAALPGLEKLIGQPPDTEQGAETPPAP